MVYAWYVLDTSERGTFSYVLCWIKISTYFAFIARLLKDHTFSSVINRFPLKIELLLMFVFLLIQPLFTGWSGIKGVNWAIQDFLSTYFLFFLGFASLPSNVNIWKNIKNIYILFFLS